MSQLFDIKYKKVAAFTTDDDTSIVPPSGELIGISKFRATGSDPSTYVLLAYDFGGPNEKIFASTRGDVDYEFETSIASYQIIGDGIAKLGITIVNDSATESPIVGGSFEAFNFGVPS